ncbi:MAG: hypothetical protein IJR89_06385 [Clostridia bacterium]|nr:hypothetical protein [Clostridia bacterium]
MKKTQKEFTAAVWRRVEEKREAEKKRARIVRRLSFAAASAACLLLVIGLFPVIRGGFEAKRSNAPGDCYSAPGGAPTENEAREQTASNASMADTLQKADTNVAAEPCDGDPETAKPDTGEPKQKEDTRSPEAPSGTGATVYGEENEPVRFRIRDTQTEGLLTDPAKIARLRELVDALTVERDPDPQKAGADRAVTEVVIGEEKGTLVFGGISYRVEQNAAWRELSDFLRRCAEEAE